MTLPLVMSDDQNRAAAEYRRQAQLCLQVARHMSLRDHRDSLKQMAEQWLALAEKAEGKAD